jgi:hypothetical protein
MVRTATVCAVLRLVAYLGLGLFALALSAAVTFAHYGELIQNDVYRMTQRLVPKSRWGQPAWSELMPPALDAVEIPCYLTWRCE